MKQFLSIFFILWGWIGSGSPGMGQQVFINEIHYNNAGADIGEVIEIAGPCGTHLTNRKLFAYNGSGGKVYHTLTLWEDIPNQENGFGSLLFSYPPNGIQNGFPDGIALGDAENNVIQFLSNGGSFTSFEWPVDGMVSEDIGVLELPSTPIGKSLQLQGSGKAYCDFFWSDPIPHTYGQIYRDQSFIDRRDSITAPVEVSIAKAKLLPTATEVRVQGVLTVTHQFGGPAYIQDETGGIPIYDSLIHYPGLFQIGDHVKVTGKLAQFNQQIQLVDISAIEVLGPVEPVHPKRVSIEQLADLEGILVTISAAEFLVPKGLLYPDNNYKIFDASGSMELRVDGDVHDLLGRFVPATTEDITGVLGSYGGTLQLLPRFKADLPGTSPYFGGGSDIPPELTLDIMTWNMEFFGATIPGFGPADVRLQMQNALRILQDSSPDLIAVQEIADPELLGELTTLLPGYALQCSDRFSRSFEAPDPTFPEQRLCFIYNTEVIEWISDRPLFETFYDEARTGSTDAIKEYPTGTASSFWASGRLPYLVEVDATIQNSKERIIFINIHAKSGITSMDLERKRYDIHVLKDSLNVLYAENNVVLLGDYNDDLDVSIGGGPSTYEVILHDSNYIGISLSLSEAGLRSYLYHDHMIDHIIISNELLDNYLEWSAQLLIPFGSITNYVHTTSDHLPVLARFLPGIKSKSIDEKQEKFNQAKIRRYFPNPFSGKIKIVIDQSISLPIKTSLHDLGGNVIFGGVDEFINGECELDLIGCTLKPGLYFLLLQYGTETKLIRLVKW